MALTLQRKPYLLRAGHQVERGISVFRARIKRFRNLFVLALRLLASGQYHMVLAAMRRRFLPAWLASRIEYVSAEPPREIECLGPAVGSEVEYLDHAAEGRNGAAEPTGKNNTSLLRGAPLVSVVIPCFNYGRFIQAAVDSVKGQTLKSVEIIIVEGGSTDGETPAIVSAIKGPNIRVIMQEQQTLVGANRNTGIALARGRYVCCLDADDTIEPTYLEKALYFLEAHCYDIVSTGIRFSGQKSGTIDVLENPNLRDMTDGNHVTTCAVFRTTLWEKVGGFFDTGKGEDHVAEDWDFWLRCVAAGARVRNITGEHLFNYMIHPHGSLSSTDVRSIAEQRRSILERNRDLLTQERLQDSSKQARRRIVKTPYGALPIPASPNGNLSSPTTRRLLVAVPFLIVGGAERLLSTVLGYLARLGWQITIVSTLPQKGLDDASSWFTAFTDEVYMLPRFLHEWEFQSFLHYLVANRGFDAALVAGSRVFYELIPDLRLRYPQLAIIDLLFNTSGHTASHLDFKQGFDFVIGENPEVIAWFKGQGWPSSCIRLIESGVDVNRFETTRSPEVEKRLSLSKDDIVVGFSGRLSDEKAPEVFVQLAGALRDQEHLRFVMTGAGPEKDRVETIIGKLPVETRLDFLGMVDNPMPYFATYDIFVLPSRLDGRPIALLEALASGCAVVASNVGGIPAVLEHTQAGVLCRPDNLDDFVNAVRALGDDRQRLKRMKASARESAARMLSEVEMCENYRAAIEAAIRIRTAPPEIETS
ncbi:glycosyltransferase [Rhizobium sp. AQ_MP]|jgi:glycosyltransferase involved in cell wall biosynthesis|uniref:glycosyltransferase n=1 Tax=Rhizobium sp. AQ_MP TaxID=2761536 RepID=UPI001FEE2DF2|nr:glycosyltransferase [Rhizobium sp. AQ_MP]